MNAPCTTQKSGAALVIVLGFLAILTVLVIAFTAQTRTERLAGRAYLDTAQTRHLLHTALSRAMEDIDEIANTNYPDFFATNSLGEANEFVTDTIRFDAEEDYFPAGNAAISIAYEAALAQAEWQAITAGTSTVGRVGYIVVNASGLLDANSVGGAPRAAGLSPREIQLSGSAANLAADRDTKWRRYETLRDLRTLTGLSSITDFSTFSLYPAVPSPAIDLSKELNGEQFKSILTKHCGLDAQKAQAVYENYLDYIDEDSIPYNLLGTSPEAVPMVNELWVENFQFIQNAEDTTNISYEISGDLFVETWFPFEGTRPLANVELYATDPARESTNQVEVLVGEESIGVNDYVTIDAVYSNGVVKSFILELDNPETVQKERFSTTKLEFSYDDSVVLEQPFIGDEAPFPIIVLVKHQSIEVAGLDKVENTELAFTYDESGSLENQYASCVDPRVNTDFSDATLWVVAKTNSLNAINEIEDWGEESDLKDKTNITFYVRNAPMKNAAELGHLSVGIPWRTVQLCSGDQAMHPVLDHFHAGESFRSAEFLPGLVNLNSPHTNALATTFFNAPIQINPEDAAPAKKVTEEQATAIAQNLAALTNRQYRVSAIGNAVSSNIPDWNELTDAQKESIVANSYRLFGWRDTLYTLLLVAQGGTDADGDGGISDDEVRSTQKAVAYVWRDPSTGKAAVVFWGLSDTLQSSIGSSGNTWSDILEAFKP